MRGFAFWWLLISLGVQREALSTLLSCMLVFSKRANVVANCSRRGESLGAKQ